MNLRLLKRLAIVAALVGVGFFVPLWAFLPGIVAVAVGAAAWRLKRVPPVAPPPVPQPGEADPRAVIRLRRSWRSYDSSALPNAVVSRLRDFAAAPDVSTGPFSATRIRVLLLEAAAGSTAEKPRRIGTYGFIHGARYFFVGMLRQGQSEADFGYVFERIVLEATRLGLATCWLGGTFSKADVVALVGDQLQDADERVYCVSPVGYPAAEAARIHRLRVSSAEQLVRRPPRRPFAELFFDAASAGSLDVGTLPPPFGDAAEAVRLAPSASNSQPWRVQRGIDGKCWHFFAAYAPRLVVPFATNDLGVAACHWEAALAAAGIAGSWKTLTDPVPSPPVPNARYHFTWVPNT